MRVYIGPYINRWISKVHDRHMEIKYGNDWDENKDWEDRAWERFEDALQSFYNATINKYLDNKKRKIVVKLHNYDTWGMDTTLAHIILPMLKQLKATKHGSPFVDDEDVPENLRSTSAPPKENEHDTDDNHHKRWDYILSSMIWSFEQITREDRESQFYSGEFDWNFVKEEGSNFSRMEYGPNHTFKVDREAQKEYEKEIQRGLNLFSKYFHALWD